MDTEPQQNTKRTYFVTFFTLMLLMGTLILLLVLLVFFNAGRAVLGYAPWGPKIGGELPNGMEVHFQARPVGFETDDRLTVVAPNTAPKHYWVDRVHGGFAHVVLKYNDTGTQLWVESDGTVGASIDLTTSDFRAEHDTQHAWAEHGTGTTLDAGHTSSVSSLLRPW